MRLFKKEKLILKVFSIIDKLTITECEACINFYAGCYECLLDWVYQVVKYCNVAYRNLLSTDRGFRQIDEDMSNCFEILKRFKIFYIAYAFRFRWLKHT